MRSMTTTGMVELAERLHLTLRVELRGSKPRETLERYVRRCGEIACPIRRLEADGSLYVPGEETESGDDQRLYANQDWFDGGDGRDAPGELQ